MIRSGEGLFLENPINNGSREQKFPLEYARFWCILVLKYFMEECGAKLGAAEAALVAALGGRPYV